MTAAALARALDNVRVDCSYCGLTIRDGGGDLVSRGVCELCGQVLELRLLAQRVERDELGGLGGAAPVSAGEATTQRLPVARPAEIAPVTA